MQPACLFLNKGINHHQSGTKQRKFHILEWSGQSTDLNLIEMLWHDFYSRPFEASQKYARYPKIFMDSLCRGMDQNTSCAGPSIRQMTEIGVPKFTKYK